MLKLNAEQFELLKAGTNNKPFMKKGLKEIEIMNQILKYLRLKGVFCWRNNNTGVFDPVKKIFRKSNQLKGVSDILGITIGGRFLAIEVKSEKGRASGEQLQFLSEVKSRGGVSILARSLDDVMNVI